MVEKKGEGFVGAVDDDGGEIRDIVERVVG